jgi:hypothetical protein
VPDKPDDLEAVRKLAEVLSPFAAEDQERIIRWVREKLGLPTQVPDRTRNEETSGSDESRKQEESRGSKDIKTFVTEKNPTSDNQFAATVAHYYRFVAPQATRKDFITSDDLQQACRLTGRNRLLRPAQTLIHAHTNGLLDKGANRGEYVISTVGENLVAVSLPGAPATTQRRGTKPTRKKGTHRSGQAPKPARKK